MNQLTRDQVTSLAHLAKEEGLVTGSIDPQAIDDSRYFVVIHEKVHVYLYSIIETRSNVLVLTLNVV